MGLPAQVVDRDGRTTRYVYDADDRRTGVGNLGAPRVALSYTYERNRET